MRRTVAFFEIPAIDFNRAMNFYQTILGVSLFPCDCATEKMAFFPEEDGKCPGAVSWTSEMRFNPSQDGVLISLTCEDVERTLSKVQAYGGTTVIPKTKIEADNMGYFGVFIDSEGNRIGLYSDK